MKAKFLKIAGVKSEKEFYKKYPTEAAFFKAHPEAKKLKKAEIGSYIGGEQISPNIVSYENYENLAPLQVFGKTKEQMEKEELSQYAKQNVKGMEDIMDSLQELSSGFKNIGINPRKKINIKSSFDPKAAAIVGLPKTTTRTSVLPGRKEGGKVKKAQTGVAAAAQSKDLLGGISQGLPLVGNLINAIGSIGQMKQQRKELERSSKVSDVAVQASRTQPERTARRYVRPEDAITSPNERFIPGGTGTEILAQYGASIGGTPTEIQNTYNPGDLYSNLGYEPLSESDIVKQYRSGGAIPKAVTGFEKFMSGGGGQAVSNLIGAGFSQVGGGAAAGSQIGGALGQGLSMIPGVGAIAGPALSLLGGAAGAIIDAKGAKQQKLNKDKLKSNISTISLQDSARGLQSNYSSFVRNGGNIPQAEVGWVSHDWQPQKIAYFGEHSMKDLLKPPSDADMLRTGGNLRQNNLSELDQFNFGGSLKTHWGGRADVDSYNPYLPGTGETVMFKGNQHSESDGKGRTGIGVSYGPKEHDSYTDYAEYGTEQAADVEVENGEPAAQLPDGEGGLAMTVYGALKINNHAADEIGDPEAKGLTYKKYIDRINEKENKANNKMAKANEQLEDLKVVTPFDRLKLNSLQATIQGEDQKLKDYAVKKVTAAEVQNAYNETAEEYGIDADALAKGKIKPSKDMGNAKYGTKKAQGGLTIPQMPDKGDKKAYAEWLVKNIFPITGMNISESDLKTTTFEPTINASGITNFSPQTSGKYTYDDVIRIGEGEIKKIGKTYPDKREYKATTGEGTNRPSTYTKWPYSSGPKSANLKKQAVGWDQIPEGSNLAGGLPLTDELREQLGLKPLKKPSGGFAARPDLFPPRAKDQDKTSAKKPKKSTAVTTSGGYESIVDYLKRTNVPSDFQSRKKLAEEKGIKNYTGTDTQNIQLINILKNEKVQDVVAPETPVTPELTETLTDISALERAAAKGLPGFKDYLKRKSVDAGLKADKFITDSKEVSSKAKKKDKIDWIDFAKIASGQLANLLRRPLQEDLDASQLLPEMLAKSQNQLQPVQAQTYQPLLDTPFDVSYKDQLNENQATFNAFLQSPVIASNPAALQALASQKYAADSKVLADQFRTNQALRAGVFSKNRDTLNDAALKNLAILDQQYVRQQEALSKTKATDLEIAKSIADKIAKNRLENRTFAAYSNLFPQYGFNRNMMAISQAPTFFTPGVVPGLTPEDAKDFQEWKDQKNKTKTQSSTTGKYGKNLKKHFQNGSIVKSLKNI